MATNESNALQGRTVFTESCAFLLLNTNAGVVSMATPVGDTASFWLSSVVPYDGAELLAASYTILSLGTGNHEQSWTISDGTNILMTMSGLAQTSALGTVTAMTMGTATNGKNIATSAGNRLTITNTSVGTSTIGSMGVVRLVWAG